MHQYKALFKSLNCSLFCIFHYSKFPNRWSRLVWLLNFIKRPILAQNIYIPSFSIKASSTFLKIIPKLVKIYLLLFKCLDQPFVKLYCIRNAYLIILRTLFYFIHLVVPQNTQLGPQINSIFCIYTITPILSRIFSASKFPLSSLSDTIVTKKSLNPNDYHKLIVGSLHTLST